MIYRPLPKVGNQTFQPEGHGLEFGLTAIKREILKIKLRVEIIICSNVLNDPAV